MRGTCRAGVVLITAAVPLALLNGAAAAHPRELRSDADVQQLTVGERPRVLPLVATRLAPGMTVTARFEVHRGTAGPGGRLVSEITDLADDDNGCQHAEAAAGDTSCGRGQGELSTELRVRLAWEEPTPGCSSAGTASTGPTLAAADDVPVLAPAAVEAEGTACLVLHVDLPRAADNLVQSDSSRFALRIGVDGGTTLGGGTVDASTAPTLPQTGLEVGAELALAGGLVLLGAGLLGTGGRRGLTA